ncbi:MAG: hypothetical protein ROZ64_13670 [Burkholderiaceae bacterium]|nr:hypothetical protein [Burkholderiaceae bacterium]
MSYAEAARDLPPGAARREARRLSQERETVLSAESVAALLAFARRPTPARQRALECILAMDFDPELHP